MGFLVKEDDGVRLPPVPQGVHVGVCYAVYDIGTHFSEKFGKHTHQMLIAWELSEERMDVEKDGKALSLPRVVSKKYNISLHEKATLRKHLQGWRGRAFTPEELKGFDVTKLLGANCQIQIIHKVVDGKTYANIENILPAPKGLPKRDNENALVFFTFQEYMDIPSSTPDWIKELIQTSDEWECRMSGGEPPVPDMVPDDEVPF